MFCIAAIAPDAGCAAQPAKADGTEILKGYIKYVGAKSCRTCRTTVKTPPQTCRTAAGHVSDGTWYQA